MGFCTVGFRRHLPCRHFMLPYLVLAGNGNKEDVPLEAMFPYPGGWSDLLRILAQMLVLGVVYGYVAGVVL